MDRTSKISEDCDKLLDDSVYTNEKSETYTSSKINSAYTHFSDDDEVILRTNNNPISPNSTPCRRYAEVHSYPGVSANQQPRWSDLKLESFTLNHEEPAELGDDERQSLIPPNNNENEIQQDDLEQHRDSFVSNSDAGILAGDEQTSNDSDDSNASSRICEISIVERFLRTHSIWFLPGIQRSGAVHLLQGKEDGVQKLEKYKGVFAYNFNFVFL